MCLRNRGCFTKDVSAYKTAAALRKMYLSTKPQPLYERCVCLRNRTRFTKDVSVYATTPALRKMCLSTKPPPLYECGDCTKTASVYERRMCLRNRGCFTKPALVPKPQPLYETSTCPKTAAALRNHHLFLQTSLPCANSRQDSIKVSLVFFISAFVNRQPYQLQGIFSLKQNRVGL